MNTTTGTSRRVRIALLVLAGVVCLTHAAAVRGQGDPLVEPSIEAVPTPMSLSGLFETTISSTNTEPYRLEAVVVSAALTIGDLAAQLDAKFADAVFDSLKITAAKPVGDFNLSSTASFNPSTLSFLSWQAGVAVTLFDIAFSDTFTITSPQSSSYNQFTASGTAAGIAFQATHKLGLCPLEFWEASLCANWVWSVCDANASLCAQFDDVTGFRAFNAAVTGIELFEDMLGIRGTLDVAIAYALDEKTLTPTLSMKPDWPICVGLDLLGEVEVTASPLRIEGIRVYGLEGECTLDNGVTFGIYESLDDAKNGAITGKADYFEKLSVTGPLYSCCGTDGTFDVAVYFERPPAPSGALFGVGLWTGSVEMQLFEMFAFSLSMEIPPSSSDWKLSLTLRVFW